MRCLFALSAVVSVTGLQLRRGNTVTKEDGDDQWKEEYTKMVTDQKSFMGFCSVMCKKDNQSNCEELCPKMWECASKQGNPPPPEAVEECLEKFHDQGELFLAALKKNDEDEWKAHYAEAVKDQDSFMGFCGKMCKKEKGPNCDELCPALWACASKEGNPPPADAVEKCLDDMMKEQGANFKLFSKQDPPMVGPAADPPMVGSAADPPMVGPAAPVPPVGSTVPPAGTTVPPVDPSVPPVDPSVGCVGPACDGALVGPAADPPMVGSAADPPMVGPAASVPPVDAAVPPVAFLQKQSPSMDVAAGDYDPASPSGESSPSSYDPAHMSGEHGSTYDPASPSGESSPSSYDPSHMSGEHGSTYEPANSGA